MCDMNSWVRGAVGAGKQVLAGVEVDHRLVDVHGRTRLAFIGLGHERRIDTMAQGGLAHRAL
jgi:hypothetical protein